MKVYLLYYLILINIIGLWSMGEDKKRAIRKHYRLSERTLFGIAWAGGSIGSLVGMYTFRHKTKHWTFKLGIPLILIVQILIFSIILKPYLFL